MKKFKRKLSALALRHQYVQQLVVDKATQKLTRHAQTEAQFRRDILRKTR